MKSHANGARACGPRGFTLVELLVVISLIALLIGILLPAIAEARRLGRMAVCQSNVRQIAVGQGNYATDYQDRIYGFSWRTGHAESTFEDLRQQAASSDLEATAAQAVDIMRRRAGRTDIPPIFWISPVMYNHLVLQDYMAARLPEPGVVCPEDVNRREWQRDNGRLFDRGAFLPFQPAPGGANKRWPYSSSYMLTVSAFDYNQTQGIRAPHGTGFGAGQTIATRRLSAADGMHCEGCFLPVGHRLGGTTMGQVQFPSLKVHKFDKVDRHFGRDTYYLYEDARQPLLFFDGSVRTYRTMDTNRGWHPSYGNSDRTSQWTYIGEGPWDPTPRAGTIVEGHFRWTRGGLRGIDVGAGEINTGQGTN